MGAIVIFPLSLLQKWQKTIVISLTNSTKPQIDQVLNEGLCLEIE